MNRSQWLTLAIGGYLLGLAVRSWFELSWEEFGIILACVAMGIGVILWRQPVVARIFFVLIISFLGFFQVDRKIDRILEQDWSGVAIETLATVTREPEWRGTYVLMVLKTEAGIILEINVDPASNLGYGDQVKLKCTAPTETDRNQQFYLATRGINFRCANAQLEKTGKFEGSLIWKKILDGKDKLEQSLQRSISEPEASLALGFVFGGSARMSPEMKQSFSKTGLTHIIAVSGFNVTFVAEWIITGLLFLGAWRRQAMIGAILGIIIFVALVGFPASAVRAGVMISLVLWALSFGRLAQGYRALLIASGGICAVNPLLLRFDLGFQLSVLATLGIIEYSWLEKQVFKLPDNPLVNAIGVTMMAQILVLPLLIYSFHSMSLIFLLANLLVVALIPFSMIGSLAGAMGGIIWSQLGVMIGWILYLPLTFITRIVEILSRLSWSSITLPEINFGWIVLWYGILLGSLFFLHFRFGNQSALFLDQANNSN